MSSNLYNFERNVLQLVHDRHEITAESNAEKVKCCAVDDSNRNATTRKFGLVSPGKTTQGKKKLGRHAESKSFEPISLSEVLKTMRRSTDNNLIECPRQDTEFTRELICGNFRILSLPENLSEKSQICPYIWNYSRMLDYAMSQQDYRHSPIVESIFKVNLDKSHLCFSFNSHIWFGVAYGSRRITSNSKTETRVGELVSEGGSWIPIQSDPFNSKSRSRSSWKNGNNSSRASVSHSRKCAGRGRVGGHHHVSRWPWVQCQCDGSGSVFSHLQDLSRRAVRRHSVRCHRKAFSSSSRCDPGGTVHNLVSRTGSHITLFVCISAYGSCIRHCFISDRIIHAV
jgi:hypothetical protein